ncbi:Uncharacterized protein PBTT_02388 [Plasmodiophora brassicae]
MSLFAYKTVTKGAPATAAVPVALPHLTRPDRDQAARRGPDFASTARIRPSRHVDLERTIICAHARQAAVRFTRELHRERGHAELGMRQMRNRYRTKMHHIVDMQKRIPPPDFFLNQVQGWHRRCQDLQKLLDGQHKIGETQAGAFDEELRSWQDRVGHLQQRIAAYDEEARREQPPVADEDEQEERTRQAMTTSEVEPPPERDDVVLGQGSIDSDPDMIPEEEDEQQQRQDGSIEGSDEHERSSDNISEMTSGRSSGSDPDDDASAAADDDDRDDGSASASTRLSSLNTDADDGESVSDVSEPVIAVTEEPEPDPVPVQQARRSSKSIPRHPSIMALESMRKSQVDLARNAQAEYERWTQRQARIASEVAKLRSVRLTHLHKTLQELRSTARAVDSDVQAAQASLEAAVSECADITDRQNAILADIDAIGRKRVEFAEVGTVQQSERHQAEFLGRRLRAEFGEALRHLAPLLNTFSTGSDQLNVLVTCPVCLQTLRCPMMDFDARQFRCQACLGRDPSVPAVTCAELENFLSRMDVLQTHIAGIRQMQRNVAARIL